MDQNNKDEPNDEACEPDPVAGAADAVPEAAEEAGQKNEAKPMTEMEFFRKLFFRK